MTLPPSDRSIKGSETLAVLLLELKGAAARYALAGTGFDLDRLGLPEADLERFGPGVIVDYVSPEGDHLFVWTD
jgi:hypothetical protein